MMLLHQQMAEFVMLLQVNKPAKTVSSAARYSALLCFFQKVFTAFSKHRFQRVQNYLFEQMVQQS